MKTFEALRKGWEIAPQLTSLMLIVLVFNLVSGGILLGVMGVAPDQDKINQVAGVVISVLVIMTLAWGYLEGGIMSCILSQIKTGQANLDTLPQSGAKFFLRLLLLSLISGVIVTVILGAGALVTGIIVSLGSNKNLFFNLIGLIIMLAAFVVMLIVSAVLYSSRFVAVSDDIGPIASLKKTTDLFWHNFGRFIWLFFVLAIMFLAASSLANLIGLGIGKIMGAGMAVAIFNLILTAIVNAAIGIYASCVIMPMILSLSNTGPDIISIETPGA